MQLDGSRNGNNKNAITNQVMISNVTHPMKSNAADTAKEWQRNGTQLQIIPPGVQQNLRHANELFTRNSVRINNRMNSGLVNRTKDDSFIAANTIKTFNRLETLGRSTCNRVVTYLLSLGLALPVATFTLANAFRSIGGCWMARWRHYCLGEVCTSTRRMIRVGQWTLFIDIFHQAAAGAAFFAVSARS